MKFGIILCDLGVPFGGEDKIGNLMINSLKKSSDHTWEYFKACSGEIPNLNEATAYKAFIVSGSPYSVHDNYPFISDVESFIKEVYQIQKISASAPKLVGLCFGHQLINKALGANVVENKSFVFKQECVHVSKDLLLKEYYRNAYGYNQTKLDIMEIHGEEVINLPKDAVCVGSSESCRNEIILYGDSIITFQGHPEFSKKQVTDLLLPAVKNDGCINELHELEFRESMKAGNADEMAKLVQEFITL